MAVIFPPPDISTSVSVRAFAKTSCIGTVSLGAKPPIRAFTYFADASDFVHCSSTALGCAHQSNLRMCELAAVTRASVVNTHSKTVLALICCGCYAFIRGQQAV